MVGTGGTVLSSTNLTTWNYVGTLTGKSLFGVATDGAHLVTVGVEGIILRSQIVPRRTPIASVNYARSAGQNVFLFGGQPDQRFKLENSPDLFNWRRISIWNSPTARACCSFSIVLHPTFLENSIGAVCCHSAPQSGPDFGRVKFHNRQ